MNATTPAPAALDGLALLLSRARLRAASLRRPILASLTTDLQVAELPRALDAWAQCFLWQQPDRDLALLGLGQATRIEAAGANRFRHVREGLQRLLAEAVVEGPDGVSPLAFAGFAFDPDQPAETLWSAFPDGLAVLPRLLLAQRDGSSTLTLNVLVDAASDVDQVEKDLRSDVTKALTAVDLSTAPNAGIIAGASARDRWLGNVATLVGRIAAGEAQKVVLARRLEVAAEAPFVLEVVVERLRQRYPACTVFAVRDGDSCFLGATPETLVRLEGRVVRTDCLAGSYPRGKTTAEDSALGEALLADDKERREHAFVAQAICEALNEVCESLDVPEAPRLRRMANVQHLHTPIEATTDGERHVLELVERLHPTPATAGLPRQRSLCLIRAHEPFGRGWYAGPIGWLDGRGDGEFAVALRSGLVQGDRASLYAGCGIVRGSDPVREYDESAIKLETMLWALNVGEKSILAAEEGQAYAGQGRRSEGETPR